GPPAQGPVHGDCALRASLPALSERADSPARRRLLRDGDVRGAVRGDPGDGGAAMEMTRDQKTGAGGAALGGSGRWSVVWGLGMLAIFLGERMIGSGSGRTVATGAGVLLVIGAMVARFVRAGKASPDRRTMENTLLALYAVGLV